MRSDESSLLFLGFLTFLDAPKASATSCIRTLHQQGIALKVIHLYHFEERIAVFSVLVEWFEGGALCSALCLPLI